MQLLLDIDKFWDITGDIDNPVVNKKAKQDIGLKKDDSLEVVNIGPGADVLVFLVTIATTALSIWQLPTVIRTGLEDWKWLINKIKGFVKDKQLVSLDQDAAGLIAVDYLFEKYGEDSSMQLMDAHTFNLVDLSGMIYGQGETLAARPHNYYVFAFWMGTKKIIISVRSTGEIRELESFDDMPYGLTDSID